MIKDDGTVEKELKCSVCGHVWTMKFPKFVAVDPWKKCPACLHFSNMTITDKNETTFFSRFNNMKK